MWPSSMFCTGAGHRLAGCGPWPSDQEAANGSEDAWMRKPGWVSESNFGKLKNNIKV